MDTIVKPRSESQRNGERGAASKPLYRSALPQEAFHRMICLERRRTSRSRKSALLMLLQHSEPVGTTSQFKSKLDVIEALSPVTRETDVTGWYVQNAVIGVMFTEIVPAELPATTTTIRERVTKSLKTYLAPGQFDEIRLSFHLVPEPAEDAAVPIAQTGTEHPMAYAVNSSSAL